MTRHSITTSSKRHAAILGLGVLLTLSTTVLAQTPSTSTTCMDGQYRGKLSGRSEYYKDDYTWAVSREFAKRFCMPEEFIADDLKGAEAIAYRYKSSATETCVLANGNETCGRFGHSHWLELYVKAGANIPKYDPEVSFYVRDMFSSKEMLGAINREKMLVELEKRFKARARGEVTEPPGQRHPFRGYTPAAQGKHTGFHYMAKMSPTTADERATAFRVEYYQARIYEDLDLIALDGWANGNMVGSKLPDAPLGFALAVWVGSRDISDGTLRYPGDVLHFIDMPKRITDVMHAIDGRNGKAFEDAVRSNASTLRPVIPAPGTSTPAIPLPLPFSK